MPVLLILVALVQDAELPEPPFEAKVTTKRALVRKEPKALSEVAAEWKWKDEVLVQEASGDWRKARRIEKRDEQGKAVLGAGGWLHRSCLMEAELFKAKEEAMGGDPARGAESNAYAKGWDPKTEAEYKATHGMQADFERVDWLEKTPSYRRDSRGLEEKLRRFMKEGNLGGRGS